MTLKVGTDRVWVYGRTVVAGLLMARCMRSSGLAAVAVWVVKKNFELCKETSVLIGAVTWYSRRCMAIHCMCKFPFQGHSAKLLRHTNASVMLLKYAVP